MLLPCITHNKWSGFLRCPLLILCISVLHMFAILLYSVSSKTIQTKTNVAVTGGSPPLLLFTPKYLPHRRILGLGINQSAACLFETSTLLRKYYLSIWEQCFANHFWLFNFDSFGVYFPSMGKTSKHLLPGLICRLNAEHCSVEGGLKEKKGWVLGGAHLINTCGRLFVFCAAHCTMYNAQLYHNQLVSTDPASNTRIATGVPLRCS